MTKDEGLNAGPLAESWPQMAVLAALATATLTICVLRFRS